VVVVGIRGGGGGLGLMRGGWLSWGSLSCSSNLLHCTHKLTTPGLPSNLEGCTLNEADLCGDPPLVLAAGNGHLVVLKYLLAEGAGVEQRSVMQETALM